MLPHSVIGELIECTALRHNDGREADGSDTKLERAAAFTAVQHTRRLVVSDARHEADIFSSVSDGYTVRMP